MGDFLLVPIEDVLFNHVFDYLSFLDLMRLRPTCKQMNDMINTFIQDYMTELDFSKVGRNKGLKCDNFLSIINNKTNIKVLNFEGSRDIYITNVLASVIMNNQNVTHLNLSRCSGLQIVLYYHWVGT